MDQAHWDQSTQLFTKLSTENVQNFQPVVVRRMIFACQVHAGFFSYFFDRHGRVLTSPGAAMIDCPIFMHGKNVL
jgi:hypothetical protein